MSSLKKAANLFYPGSDHWYKHESEQMKKIHKAYKDSMRDDLLQLKHMMSSEYLDATLNATPSPNNNLQKQYTSDSTNNGDNTNDPEQSLEHNDVNKKNDNEYYLPKDSVLRSVAGEMYKPLNCPFKDFKVFEEFTSFEHWRAYFQEEGNDRFLSEVAQSLVSHICQSQARKELRVRHGSIPLGKVLREKREHITPLALVLHELKTWATHKLRVSSILDESTHIDIAKRIKYVDKLQLKEVWGQSKGALKQGMRPIAHDRLFRLLLTTREDLIRAKEYAFRGYSRRKSREKLAKLADSLKNILLNEIRLLSTVLTVNEKLTDPKSFRLQPTDLLNSSQNQSYVDYTNLANVCLKAFVEIPLVRGALLSEFDTAAAKAKEEIGKNAFDNNDENTRETPLLKVVQTWRDRNLFCLPGPQKGSDPIFLEDNSMAGSGMPAIYSPQREKLEQQLKKVDKKAKLPLKPKDHIKQFNKQYNSSDDTPRVLRTFMKLMAALQDLVPACLAVHEFWSLSGK